MRAAGQRAARRRGRRALRRADRRPRRRCRRPRSRPRRRRHRRDPLRHADERPRSAAARSPPTTVAFAASAEQSEADARDRHRPDQALRRRQEPARPATRRRAAAARPWPRRCSPTCSLGLRESRLVDRIVVVSGEPARTRDRRASLEPTSSTTPTTSATPKRPRSASPTRSARGAGLRRARSPATARCSTPRELDRELGAQAPGVAVVPDRHGTGTNGLHPRPARRDHAGVRTRQPRAARSSSPAPPAARGPDRDHARRWRSTSTPRRTSTRCIAALPRRPGAGTDAPRSP